MKRALYTYRIVQPSFLLIVWGIISFVAIADNVAHLQMFGRCRRLSDVLRRTQTSCNIFWNCFKVVIRFAFNVCCGLPSALDAGVVLGNAAHSAGLAVFVARVIGVQLAPLLVVAGRMRCVIFLVWLKIAYLFVLNGLSKCAFAGGGNPRYLLPVLHRSIALPYECWTARIRQVGLAICCYRRFRGCEIGHCMR